MYGNLWLIPFFPLLGAIINGLFGKKIKNEAVIGGIGTLMIFLSFLVAVQNFFRLIGDTEKVHEIVLASWMTVGNLQVNWELLLDPLSAVMILVVTGVGTLIHLYSIGYMHGETGYFRFFSYLNLFAFSMLMLVLGGNALVMFIGWEGVGLCSYLLIGYYYEKKSASDAAKKAFVVNRIGDFGFLCGLFILFWALAGQGVWTINSVEIAANAHLLEAGGALVTIITLAFFLGATGKSAQIPLFTWLPDAMEGPTPVSALIHAATMVTAGVYMIGRMNILFAMAPSTMMTIAIIGAATAFLAASIGFAQNDIKRVLAYSTVSQLGYMFLAMGVGAFSAGIFHLMTHAFFKACLFLGSGSVIHGMHHAYHHAHLHDDPQDMRNMGGLRSKMPITYWTFLLSTIAIAGVPLFSGFFSKDEILWWSFGSTAGHPIFWIIAVSVAGMTAFYMFRLVFMTFFGAQRTDARAKDHIPESPWTITVPLIVLAFLAVVGGYVGVPKILGGGNHFGNFLAPVFGHAQELYHLNAHGSHALEYTLIALSVSIALFGIYMAWLMYMKNPALPAQFTAKFAGVYRFVFNKWYIDELYDFVFVNPCKRFGTFLWKIFDVRLIDGIVNGCAWVVKGVGAGLRYTQTGYMYNYAVAMVVGVVVIVGFYVFG